MTDVKISGYNRCVYLRRIETNSEIFSILYTSIMQ